MSNPTPTTSKWQTDWSKLSAKKHNEIDLKSPPTRYSYEQDGYAKDFLDPARLDEGGGIERH